MHVDTFSWRELHPDGKYRRLSHSSTQIGSYLFVIGGHDGTKYLHDILLFNLGKLTNRRYDLLLTLPLSC